jgi:pimeloyl-ACP methyl ester carboxylesterase
MGAENPQFAVPGADGTSLAGESAGAGQAIVLLHGLTATRRYVVMGSRLLERSGMRVISYDARGHGRSGAAPTRGAYDYGDLAGDVESVMDAMGVDRAILAGTSMGAHTALRLALSNPARVSGLALITPAYDPDRWGGAQELAGWDALAAGLREGGVEGFVAAYDLEGLPEAWREVVGRVLRQRLSAHEHPLAVADALEAVPRSRPFESLEELATVTVPTLVVGSRDEADPGHPLRVAELYARRIAGARLAVEQEGSPIAWQGGQLSRLLLELGERSAAAAA